MTIDWTAVTPTITAIGVLLTAVGAFLATRQLRMAYRVAKHTFLYRQYELMQHHNAVHIRIVGGEWANGSGPATSEEWNAVKRYMGLLESVQLLIRDRVLTPQLADTLYSHRVFPLAQHPVIREHLLENDQNRFNWETFIALRDTLAKERVYRTHEKLRRELASKARADTALPSPQAKPLELTEEASKTIDG